MRQTKYTVKFTTQFKKDYKLAKRQRITLFPGIGLATGNVIFSRTGCLSIGSRILSWC